MHGVQCLQLTLSSVTTDQSLSPASNLCWPVCPLVSMISLEAIVFLAQTAAEPHLVLIWFGSCVKNLAKIHSDLYSLVSCLSVGRPSTVLTSILHSIDHWRLIFINLHLFLDFIVLLMILHRLCSKCRLMHCRSISSNVHYTLCLKKTTMTFYAITSIYINQFW